MKEIESNHNKNLRDDKCARRRLTIACEVAKNEISSQTSTDITVNGLLDGKNFSVRISRTQFDELNEDLFKATIKSVQSALDHIHMDKSKIDEVILVGGSTRIIRIQTLLGKFFKGKKLHKTVHADEAVAYGAAMLANSLGEYSEDGHPVSDCICLGKYLHVFFLLY